MRFLLNLLSLLLLVSPVWGHLGLTVPVGAGGIIRDTVIGDPYRYPNNGYCSGVSQPSPNKGRLQVGQTYNFRMNTGPAAPHGGGHCAFFVTTNGYNFYKLDDVAHCTCAPGQPGGTLNSGCAQNLGAGIQNQAIHSLTIPKNVPAACATSGCTLVWFWTPTFSAVCEIYSDCYDVIIDGATGGIESGVQLQGYPSRCSYPASNGLTTNYGAIIGKSGNGGTNTGGNNGGNTGGNNGGNTDGTNTGGTGTGTIRCGTSWTDANNKCGTACTNSDAQCPRGEFCFKDLKTCTGSTPAAPKPPSNGGNTGGSSGCRASGVFANTPGMNAWCASNCALGNCPPSHCACTGAFTVSSSALEIEMYGAEIMEAYQPQCQAMIANGIASIRDMLTRMDSVAYFNYTQFSNETSEQVIHQAEQQSMEQVIKRLIKLNNMVLPDNKKLYNETDVPTKGTIILMPGDCEMLGNDPSKLVPHTMVDLASGEKVYNNKSNTGSLSTPGLSLVILSFLLVCLSIML